MKDSLSDSKSWIIVTNGERCGVLAAKRRIRVQSTNISYMNTTRVIKSLYPLKYGVYGVSKCLVNL